MLKQNPFDADNDPINNIQGKRMWTPGRFNAPTQEEFLEDEPKLEHLDIMTGINADAMLLISPAGDQKLKMDLANCTRRWLELQVHSLATKGKIDDLGIPLLTDPYPWKKARLETNLAVAYGTVASSNTTPDPSPFWLETARLFGLAQTRFEELGSKVDQAILHLREGQMDYERAAQMFLREESGWEHFAKKAESHFMTSLKTRNETSDYAVLGLCQVYALLNDRKKLKAAMGAHEARMRKRNHVENSLIRYALSQLAVGAKTTNGSFIMSPSGNVEHEIKGFLTAQNDQLDRQTPKPLKPATPPRVFPLWALDGRQAA